MFLALSSLGEIGENSNSSFVSYGWKQEVKKEEEEGRFLIQSQPMSRMAASRADCRNGVPQRLPNAPLKSFKREDPLPSISCKHPFELETDDPDVVIVVFCILRWAIMIQSVSALCFTYPQGPMGSGRGGLEGEQSNVFKKGGRYTSSTLSLQNQARLS